MYRKKISIIYLFFSFLWIWSVCFHCFHYSSCLCVPDRLSACAIRGDDFKSNFSSRYIDKSVGICDCLYEKVNESIKFIKANYYFVRASLNLFLCFHCYMEGGAMTPLLKEYRIKRTSEEDAESNTSDIICKHNMIIHKRYHM